MEGVADLKQKIVNRLWENYYKKTEELLLGYFQKEVSPTFDNISDIQEHINHDTMHMDNFPDKVVFVVDNAPVFEVHYPVIETNYKDYVWDYDPDVSERWESFIHYRKFY